jgi:microcystin-dependent protein
VIFDDELLPLVGDKSDFITIREKVVSITAKGNTYKDARKTRTAEYTHIPNGEKSKLVEDFEVVNEEARRQHYVPKGAIMMWSGAVENIPAGWALCDGANGTPNLRGRFIVGYNPNDTDYNTIGNLGGEKEVTLTADECALPSHWHDYTLTTLSGKKDNGGALDHRNSGADGYDLNYTNAGTTSTSKPAEKAHENRPPYYVLAYIMKTV